MRIYSRLFGLLLVGLIAVPFLAEEDKKTGWSNSAELGLVATGGNSDVQTLSLKNESTRSWEKSSFRINVGAIKSETTTTSRIAIGLPGSAIISETNLTEISAEAYYVSGRFDKQITENFFWFTGAGWDRNRPSGIDSRSTAFGGVGNTWRDDEKVTFKTDYALSYTDQEDVVPSPTSAGSYVGFRGSWGYRHQLTKTAEYLNDFVVDYSLEDSDNWRANMTNAVGVSISSKLALKVSLTTLYNNAPPMSLIPLYDMDPLMGGVLTGTEPYELDELDTLVAASLVVSF